MEVNGIDLKIIKEIKYKKNRLILTFDAQTDRQTEDKNNIFCFNEFNQLVWQIRHEVCASYSFDSMLLENEDGKLIEPLDISKDYKLIVSCETSYPWQRLDFEVDLLTGEAICIRDTHNIWNR